MCRQHVVRPFTCQECQPRHQEQQPLRPSHLPNLGLKDVIHRGVCAVLWLLLAADRIMR